VVVICDNDVIEISLVKNAERGCLRQCDAKTQKLGEARAQKKRPINRLAEVWWQKSFCAKKLIDGELQLGDKAPLSISYERRKLGKGGAAWKTSKKKAQTLGEGRWTKAERKPENQLKKQPPRPGTTEGPDCANREGEVRNRH